MGSITEQGPSRREGSAASSDFPAHLPRPQNALHLTARRRHRLGTTARSCGAPQCRRLFVAACLQRSSRCPLFRDRRTVLAGRPLVRGGRGAETCPSRAASRPAGAPFVIVGQGERSWGGRGFHLISSPNSQGSPPLSVSPARVLGTARMRRRAGPSRGRAFRCGVQHDATLVAPRHDRTSAVDEQRARDAAEWRNAEAIPSRQSSPHLARNARDEQPARVTQHRARLLRRAPSPGACRPARFAHEASCTSFCSSQPTSSFAPEHQMIARQIYPPLLYLSSLLCRPRFAVAFFA